MDKKLYRIPARGKVAGVCAGLAEYVNIDVTLIRILFVVAIFVTSGFAIIIYFVMALIMPTEVKTIASGNLNQRVNTLVKDISTNSQTSKFRNIFGIGLIVIGLWYLLDLLWPGWFDIRWSVVWPLILIVVGIIIIMQGRK